MPLLTPEAIAVQRLSDSGFAVLQDEIMGEKASSLGHHGRLVEKALAALRAFDPTTGTAEERLALARSAQAYVLATHTPQRRAAELMAVRQTVIDRRRARQTTGIA